MSADSADALKKLYPNHSLVMTSDWQMNILGLPGVAITPKPVDDLITNLMYLGLRRKGTGGQPAGFLVDSVDFGAFEAVWKVGPVILLMSYILNLNYLDRDTHS